MIKGSTMNSEHAKKISDGQKRAHAHRRQIIVTYGAALAKIARSKTAHARIRNIALKALNGKGA